MLILEVKVVNQNCTWLLYFAVIAGIIYLLFCDLSAIHSFCTWKLLLLRYVMNSMMTNITHVSLIGPFLLVSIGCTCLTGAQITHVAQPILFKWAKQLG